MSTLKVYDMAGQELADVELADGLLETDKGKQAVRDVVCAEMAHRRRGTASVRTKGMVAGSGRKPWRQKGTGRARAGYKQSPVWRGGAVAFGPQPHAYGGKVNRKVSRLAFRRVLGDKVAAGGVRVLDKLDVPEPRTRIFAEMLKALKVDMPVLFLVDAFDETAVLAGRNIPGVEMIKAADVSLVEMMRYPTVVITRSGLAQLEGRLNGGTRGESE